MVKMEGLIAIACLAGLAFSGDWNQFNGPSRNGVSPEKGLANQWSENGPKQLWEIEVGLGFGGAVIQGDRVFFTDREGDQKDLVRCVNLLTGKELWRMTSDMPGRLPFDGSRCTPTLDGDLVYAVSPFGKLYVLEAETGKVAWEQAFMETFESEPPRWGYSHSPLIVGEKVIIAPMSAKANLAAFNKKTGDLVWQSEGAGGDGYVSPNLVQLHGVSQILMLNKDRLMSVNPENGSLLWAYSGYQNPIPIPHPTVLPDNKLFLSGGYGAGSVMIQVEKAGDQWNVKELFRLEKRGSQVQQVIHHEGYLYANFNTNENMRSKEPEGLLCMDMDGKTMWQTKEAPDMNRGNFIIADGKIFALGGEDGVLHMIEASPDGFKSLASQKMFETKERENMIWAPMALANGKLVLRNQSVMKCVELR